jgi:hypothetical protein
MPFRKLTLKPGVNLEQTPTLNQFQLAASNLVRFYNGLVQKLGGWVQMTTQQFIGTCRGLHAWADITGNRYVGIGTEQRLQVLVGGMISDITPVEVTDNPAVSFSTTNGSASVTITDAGHSPLPGDWINLQTQVSVGGIVLFGYYQVVTSNGTNQFTVTAAALATSTVTNGGAVPSYTTTNLSPTVSVALNNHGFGTGDLFNAAVSTTVATVVISGIFSVTVVDANHFTITAGSNANASTTASENAGNARIQYLLDTGGLVDVFGSGGYGGGNYGGGPYGGVSSTILTPLRQWSLDHFGQDLIASPTNGLIYFWQPPTVQPATVVSGSAPLASTAVFVLPQAQIIVALGAETGGTQQPLLVRWCDAGDFTDWTATAVNQAGSYFLSQGSALVGGLAIGLGGLIWTDQDIWSVTYLGFPLVLGFNKLAQGCGLIASRAAGVAGNLVMWLGPGEFFQAIGGTVLPMECPVWDFYWYNRQTTNFGQIHCAVNVSFNEMAWHFPISTSSPLFNPLAPFGYVKYNYAEKVWDYGLSSQYQRSAWMGQSLIGQCIGADLNGLLQAHEVGFDANGQAMLWSWQSGYFDLAEGEKFVFSDWLIPDFITIGSPTMEPTIFTQDYPNDPPTSVVVGGVSPMTFAVTYGARGRQMSVGFAASGASIGDFSRLGAIRVRYAPDGSF